MTKLTQCAICQNSDLRRLIELGWNAKMSVPDITHAFGGVPSHAVTYKHLKEHCGPEAYSRTIAVEDARPMRERVLAVQRAQVEAIERRMDIAQRQADDYNETYRGGPDYDPARGDPSYYFDILGKDMQAAVSSILKSEGLTIKRETSKGVSPTDVFRLLLGDRGGMAPKHLIEDGMTIEGEAVSTDGDI